MGATEGRVEVDGHAVWYKRVGDGAGHDYLEPLEALATDRTVVFYDQLGCGNSDRPTDTSLWRIERFVREVDTLRKALELEKVHLLGHSWGGWLAIEYELSQPQGIISLTLASTSASARQFVSEATKLKAALPRSTFEIMQRCEAAGDSENPEYGAAVMEFYKRHLCRLDPWPDSLLRSIGNLEGNPVYATMNGPNEFTVTGYLREWDKTDRLGEIEVPTLITVGRYDEIGPNCAETLHKGIPDSEMEVFENSSHMAHAEEAQDYRRSLSRFLSRAEG